MIHPAADPEELLLAVELHPGELHLPRAVRSLLAGEVATTRQEEGDLLQPLVVEDADDAVLPGVHEALADEVDVVLQPVQPLGGVQGVEVVVLRGEGSDECVFELPLDADGGCALEELVEVFELLELADEPVLDDGHGAQQDGEGEGLLVELVVDALLLRVQLLLAVLQQRQQVAEVEGQVHLLRLPRFLLVVDLVDLGQ